MEEMQKEKGCIRMREMVQESEYNGQPLVNQSTEYLKIE
jgi:hypothetical protein